MARYGGEEFVVILPDTDTKGAYLFAESLREKIEHLNIEHQNSMVGKNVTVSMGKSAMIPNKDGTQNEIISMPWLIRLFITQRMEDEIVR